MICVRSFIHSLTVQACERLLFDATRHQDDIEDIFILASVWLWQSLCAGGGAARFSHLLLDEAMQRPLSALNKYSQQLYQLDERQWHIDCEAEQLLLSGDTSLPGGGAAAQHVLVRGDEAVCVQAGVTQREMECGSAFSVLKNAGEQMLEQWKASGWDLKASLMNNEQRE